MMKNILLLLWVCVSVSAWGQVKEDTLTKVKKPHGMQFADVLAQHKGALIFINEKEYQGKIEDIKADSVDQLSFIHGEDALKIYGKKATNGAYLITYKEAPLIDDVILPLPKSKPRLPLYILDGKVITAQQLNVIKPDDIDNSVELYDLVSIAKYGKAGKNGVLIITSKAEAKRQKEAKQITN
jgi:hypothetical protein